MSTGWLWGEDDSAPNKSARAVPNSKGPRPTATQQPVIPGTALEAPLSVSQLNQIVKGVLDDNIPPVWIEAEVSDLARPSSGHLYMTLKDSQSQIRAVMWKGAASKLSFRLEDGQALLCYGALDVYSPRGSYQFIVQKAQPKGIGALQLAFQQLHAKLAAEGLFDQERKKPLPMFPKRIGFVTSPSGAAVRDFLEVLRRRWQGVEVMIIPAKVQGKEAAKEIADGIRLGSRVRPKLDLLVVGRGGGSLEDLWCFNEEVVVRAIAACPLPTVSAVGHEIDVTLCDLAADVRALTPTEAAERILPDSQLLIQQLAAVHRSMTQHVQLQVSHRRKRLEQLASRPVLSRPQDSLKRSVQRLDELQLRLSHGVDRCTQNQQAKLERIASTLDALSPLRVMARGYTVTRDSTTSRVVSKTGQIKVGQTLETMLQDGRVESKVERILPS